MTKVTSFGFRKIKTPPNGQSYKLRITKSLGNIFLAGFRD